LKGRGAFGGVHPAQFGLVLSAVCREALAFGFRRFDHHRLRSPLRRQPELDGNLLNTRTPPLNANRRYSRCVKPSRSGHLPINGLQLYYEAHGELGASKAVPLLLIPGAFLSPIR
jgi:hypothetical protein